jgi:hypothetical protein
MKKLIIILLLCSCTKEDINVQVGMMYHIKPDIFNKGVFQPAQPVRVERIYIDPISGLWYVEATDQKNVVWYIPKEDLQK